MVDFEVFDNLVMVDNIVVVLDILVGLFLMVFWGFVDLNLLDRIVWVFFGVDLMFEFVVDWVILVIDIDVFYIDVFDVVVDCLGCGSSNLEMGLWIVMGGDMNYYYVEFYVGVLIVFWVIFM